VESSSDAIIGKTPHGIITSWNKGAERIYGYAADEIVGKHITTLAPAELYAEIDGFLEKVRKGGTVANHETERIRKDGTRINVALTLSPIRDEGGNISGISTIARDITERKQAEEALFAAQQIFRTLVENSPDIITRYDRDCRRTYVNPTYLKVAQIPQQELLGSSPAQRSPLPASGAEMLQKLLCRVLDSGVAEAIDVVWPMADKLNHWYNISAFPEFDREGNVVSVMTVSRDITERKLDEEVLRRINRELSAISNCNEILMRAEDEQALLEDICRVVCDDAGYRMAWVGYREYDEAKTIRPVAWAGVEDGYLAQAGITWADTERGRGPSGIAIRSGKSACFQDISTDPNAAPWRESAMQRGYRSSISMPLKDESANTFGLLTIYSTEPNAFTPDEIRLLEELAADLAFGIMVLRTRIERRQAEAALRKNEEKYRTLIQNIQAAVIVHGPETEILVSNSMAQEILGLTEDQLLGKTAIDPAWHFFREDGTAAALEDYPVSKVLASRKALRNYILGVHRSDQKNDVWALVNADPVFGEEDEVAQIIVTFIDITERKQIEENLKRMNERFSLSTRAARLGVWDWNLQKNELLWDDRMYELYGVRREDFAGAYEAWLKGIHPDDREMSDEISKQAQRGEREYDTEFRVVWPDGSVHYLKAYGQFVRDAEGKPLRMTGVNFDITVLKQAEDALRREQALLNRIMATSPVGIAVVDRTGQIIFANPQAENILGLSKEEMTQRNYNAPEWHSTAIDGGPFPDEEQPFSRVLATRQPVVDVQHAIAWPDGRHVLLSINGAPIFDARGDIEAVAFAIEDITERKQAEEALRRSEFGLIEAQRIAHLGSWHMDLKTNEVYWSEELYKIYGFDPALPPPLYTESMKLFTPESWERLSSAIARAVETGMSYELELELVNKEGRKGWMLARGELVRDEKGAPITVRGVVMDITERRNAEEEIRKLNLELEQRVAERTGELEAANKELEAFSYSVSHDLRTPLRAIDGFSHILLEEYATKLDEEGKRLLNVVRSNTSRMGQLIDDILRFSRAGRLEINYSEIDMEQLAYSASVELRPVVVGDKLQLEIGHLPSARGDGAMMRQVFVNLLSNAIKFSRDKEPAIIKVGGSIEGNEAVYYVKDNGAGFDMRYVDKLFGVFHRLHGVNEFEGTGIGLAIVKRIVNRHGGRVWAEGMVGEGATFYFSLPHSSSTEVRDEHPIS
jgi:PAS domain S-box-containing protein